MAMICSLWSPKQFLCREHGNAPNKTPTFSVSPNALKVKENNHLRVLLFVLSHAVLFNHLCQFRALARIVQCIGPRHLISHSFVMLALLPHRQSWSEAYLCWSWKLSILARHLKMNVLQFASWKASPAAFSSFSFNSIN